MLRSTVAQAKSAREGMESDAKQAAELAEHLSQVLQRSVEADLTEKHMASMQRITAAALAKSFPPEGGEEAQGGAGGSAAAPPPPDSRVGSGDRGAGGA